MYYCVYEIRCKSTTDVYIGSTVHIEKRWSTHLSELLKQKHANTKLQQHFNKYGVVDFIFTVTNLFSSQEEMVSYEKEQIKKGVHLLNILHCSDDLALKRNEIVWSLIKQGYTPAQVSRMFSMPTSTSHKIATALPDNWESPWKKIK